MVDLLDELKKNVPSGKTEFIAHLPEIKIALEKGHKMKPIWKILHDADVFHFGYGQFVTYVNKLIHDKKKILQPETSSTDQLNRIILGNKSEKDLV